MMKSEFIELTGIIPTDAQYEVIEEAYYEMDKDKKIFCKAYKADAHGLQKRIVEETEKRSYEAAEELKKQMKDLKAENARLQDKLEAEQEWKPWVSPEAVPQDKYDKLAKSGRLMSDDEALEWVASELGFAPSRIRILHEMPEYEVNRHGLLRTIGTVDRRPYYDATDWHYVLFEVHANTTATYELYNGEMTLI